MLRTVALSLAACFLLAGTAAAAELRIGVADMQSIGAQCDANQAAKNKYETQFKAEAAQLDKQRADFDKKAKDFEAQRSSGKLDQKTFEQRAAGLRREAQQIQEKEMATQQRVGMLQEAINQDLQELIIAAASDVAKSKSLSLILPQNTLLYTGQELDVTPDLLTAINRVWKDRGSKVPGASVDAAAPSAAPDKK
jgi:outer membrane protein